MKHDVKIISKNINLLLLKNGMSQSELAEKVGCDKATINRYLSCKISPSVKAISKIANALGVEEAELIYECSTHKESPFLKHRIRTQILESLYLSLESEKAYFENSNSKLRLEVIEEIQNKLINM